MSKVRIQPLTPLTVTSWHPLWGQRFQSHTYTHPAFSTLCRGQPLGLELLCCNCCIYILPACGPHYGKRRSVWVKDGAVLYMKTRPAFMTQHASVLTFCHGCIFWKKRRTNRNRMYLFICWSCVAHYDLRKHVCIFVSRHSFTFVFNHLLNFHLSKLVQKSYVP